MIVRASALLLFALVLLLAPGLANAQSAAVSGSVTYRDRVALPANAVVTVQIARIVPGRASEVIAEQRIPTNGAQPPFRFSVPYDPTRIDQAANYTVQANITVGNQLRFSSAALAPVITRGNPTQNVNLTLVAQARLPNTSGGQLPLLIAGAALLGAVGSFVLRRAGARHRI
jgi:putative lipoprotein